MKTFRNFLEEAYLVEMRKEDKVKGRKKTPLYVNPEINVMKKSDDGKWKKETSNRFSGKGRINPVVQMARAKRPSSKQSFGMSGYGAMANDPGAPQPQGTSAGKKGIFRGKKKSDPEIQKMKKSAPMGDLNDPITRLTSKTPKEKIDLKRSKRKINYTG
jgi:hypothetical protein